MAIQAGGFFTPDPTTYLSNKDIEEEAQRALEITKDAGNDIFPDFLWTVQINDFVGIIDYKTRATCTNPEVLKAYEIGYKHSSYWSFVDAMSAYEEYKNYISSIYGDFEMMKRASRDGYSNVYIPAMPKLMHKKKNKLLIETGFMPSREIEHFEVEPDVYAASSNIRFDSEIDMDSPPSKEMKKIFDQMTEDKLRADRISGVYAYKNSRVARTGMDSILTYLTSTTETVKETTLNNEVSLNDRMRELHEYDFVDPIILEDYQQPKLPKTIIQNGMMVKTEDSAQMEIIRTLEKNGWDFLKSSATKNMSDDAVRALNREFAHVTDFKDMTKKQKKKYAKKMAKEAKRTELESLGDARISNMLLKNRISLSRDVTEFRLSDLFGSDE